MCKVMVVDDEQDLRDMLSVMMKKEGYQIIDASSGDECFKLLEEGEKPDIILLDIMMPDMNGWEVYDKIKENPMWKDIPIVFLTVRSDKLSKNVGTSLGSDYIVKPFEFQDLKDRINKVLNDKHASKDNERTDVK